MKKYFVLFFASAICSLSAILPPDLPERGPILTTTAIIEVYGQDDFQGIVLIRRAQEPYGYAIPGGKVEYGEQVEDAVRREMMEAVHLELTDLRQFHVYSEPMRDPRFHSVEVTFIGRAIKLPQVKGVAAEAFVFAMKDIPWDELVFDHAQILRDYIHSQRRTIGSMNLFGRPLR